MIAEGLDTLKNMAHDMNEVLRLFYLHLLLDFEYAAKLSTTIGCCLLWLQEIDRQVPLMDEIDTKVRNS